MIHAEGREVCVCPECGHRCSACLGTNTVVSRDKLKDLSFVPWISQDIADAGDSLTGEAEDDAWR
ncbi:MAG: hypothetical protein IJ157_06810 [Clostridia bacterium]|nr:hypothetical protein [Clostridia bacterium]